MLCMYIHRYVGTYVCTYVCMYTCTSICLQTLLTSVCRRNSQKVSGLVYLLYKGTVESTFKNVCLLTSRKSCTEIASCMECVLSMKMCSLSFIIECVLYMISRKCCTEIASYIECVLYITSQNLFVHIENTFCTTKKHKH